MSSHVWKVGDLCSMIPGNSGEGVIYRVSTVEHLNNGFVMLKIKPAFSVFGNIKTRKTRTHNAAWCRPLELVDMANAYHSMGVFIAEEAKRLGS